MALWNKLQTELDRFGRAAQSAFDEGKARLEILRVRQLADKAAQALGYAVYNARKGGAELDADSYARLTSTLAAHEAEAQRLEAQMEEAKAARAEATGGAGDGASDATAGGDAGPTGGAAPGSAGAPGSAPPPEPPSSVDPAMGDRGPTSSGPTPPYSGPVGGY